MKYLTTLAVLALSLAGTCAGDPVFCCQAPVKQPCSGYGNSICCAAPKYNNCVHQRIFKHPYAVDAVTNEEGPLVVHCSGNGILHCLK
ncbi:unnamed protein product [Zymoseptoria tritici ST99CH_1A5]|uniref:Hydrophobin n=2 Tax=Zymoseptoria tritici TaxID=1047171 RepID=A0A1X7RZY8_ZYMT9|nr:unnamed protein product [Zymoseptoria tritici ST99CH_3D7]SMY26624.1 unnamed protein product [Zymoseptoria tritici ST99CH_1A5]